MKKLGLLLLSFAAFISMAAKDIQTVTFTVQPVIRCENCEAKIKNQLKFEKGIKAIGISRERQLIVLKYDAEKTTPQKLADSLKEIGYKATEIKTPEKKQQ